MSLVGTERRVLSGEPQSLVLELLRNIRTDVSRVDAKIDDVKSELKSELKSEINSLRADVAADIADLGASMHGMRKELSEQIVGLRRAVVEYHSVVVGHGVLISELEARLRRVEQHLNLPSVDAH